MQTMVKLYNNQSFFQFRNKRITLDYSKIITRVRISEAKINRRNKFFNPEIIRYKNNQSGCKLWQGGSDEFGK